MNMNLITNQIITDWKPHYPSLFGNHSLALTHNLAASSLFTDEALARLIEKSPREGYHVNYSQKTPGNPPKRREGEIKGLSGLEVLDTVRNGNIWVNITAPAKVDSAYGDLLDTIYAEFEERVPGFKSYKRNLTILISSPNVSVKYHSDVPGQSLWQVRGTKKLYVYPASKPFISQPALEKLILGQLRETDMPYEPWYDDYAQVHMLEAGKMLHWPLNGPHRVVNENMLNVSFTTEHWTNELRKHYAVNYANGFLRSKLGMNKLSQQVTGASYLAKLATAAAVKFTPLNPQKQKVYKVDFQVDPKAPEGVRDIEGYSFSK
ncbi:hypothetical protein [Devosia sp.]|uniref:hypothetical protein n=1 Tax=Devosia sp. TaxID=1871048 RepID=UPI003266A05F